jgi:hypothetical protein
MLARYPEQIRIFRGIIILATINIEQYCDIIILVHFYASLR